MILSRIIPILFSSTLICTLSHAEVVKLSDMQVTSSGIAVNSMEKVSTTFCQTLPGQIVVPPAQLRVVSTSQAGLLEQLTVAVGDRVKKGQVIAHLQSPDMIAAQRDFLQSLAQIELNNQSLKRDEALFKEGVIAQRRYQETHSSYQESAAAVSERKQALKLAGMADSDIARLERSQDISARVEIRAPISGVVLDVQAEPGQRLSMSDPIYRIARLDTLWIEVRAPLEQANEFKIGERIHVHGEEIDGKLIAIGRNVDEVSQTVLLRAEINKDTDKLRPGQYIQVAHVTQSESPRFQLPSHAIARTGNQAYVFIKMTEGFEVVPVTVHAISGENAIITGEFNVDAQIAISGIAAIKGAWAGLGGGD